jgi:hypothetical protein
MPTAGWITLDSCINDYLDESEQPVHKYAKCYNLAVRAMDELGLDFFYQIKSIRIPILANKTAVFPPDMIQYSKVGVFNGNGELVPMAYNGNLSTVGDLQSNRSARTHSMNLFTDYDGCSNVFYNYWDGSCIGNIYGIPGGAPFVGTFKIDLNNNVILFGDGCHYTHACLEYVAAPSMDNTYYVPVQFREAVISYLRWKDIVSLPPSRKGGVGDKQQRRHEFFNDRRVAIARFKPLRLDQEYIWNLASQRLAVKS